MTGGIDDGAILLEEPVEIGPTDTSLTLNMKCFEAAIRSSSVATRTGRGRPRATRARSWQAEVFREAPLPAGGIRDALEPLSH
jgi:hypothetical protein